MNFFVGSIVIGLRNVYMDKFKARFYAFLAASTLGEGLG